MKLNSYQSWSKSEKSRAEIEKAIEKIEKGGKNTDLVKANDNSLKLRISAEELEKEYKDQVSKCNEAWYAVYYSGNKPSSSSKISVCFTSTTNNPVSPSPE